ncbi:Hypothetical protein PBC10988_18290 [Planctomycetales bacterium 10988]|nr:Hypothetical protein PBC10988_18290 [Planctomycetales bacterium 10988]
MCKSSLIRNRKVLFAFNISLYARKKHSQPKNIPSDENFQTSTLLTPHSPLPTPSRPSSLTPRPFYPMLYNLEIECDGETRRQMLTLSSSETVRHVAMKLLAYLVYWEREPEIEKRVGQHYKPDLVCREPSNHYVEGEKITLWIECGDVAVKKLDKISIRNPEAEFIVVKPTTRQRDQFKTQVDRKVKNPERFRYLTFEDGFLRSFVLALTTRSRIVLDHSRLPDQLTFQLDEEEFSTTLLWN